MGFHPSIKRRIAVSCSFTFGVIDGKVRGIAFHGGSSVLHQEIPIDVVMIVSEPDKASRNLYL